jgi:RNA polymerase sigma factor (sigma-70 family)
MFDKNSDSDDALLTAALNGSKIALETLLKRYQDYIYNISLKLFLDPDDALDATQEVLIKIVTHLKTFKRESSFKTWLYRIAFNHFLNMPKRKYETIMGSEQAGLENYPEDVDANRYSEAEIEEVRLMCSTAMLLCLSREQRLLYIVGEIFEADHQVGAALFDISPANYRVRLHRAKMDLLSFVSGKCGLVNAENSCRCPKKTKALIDKGMVDKNSLRFNKDYKEKISAIVLAQKNDISDEIQLNLKNLFADSPFQIKAELDALMSKII